MNQHLDTWQHLATTRVVTSSDCESTTGHRRVPAPLISIEDQHHTLPVSQLTASSGPSFLDNVASLSFSFCQHSFCYKNNPTGFVYLHKTLLLLRQLCSGKNDPLSDIRAICLNHFPTELNLQYPCNPFLHMLCSPSDIKCRNVSPT